MKIIATFIRRRFQDSGKDQAPDYYVYEFSNIKDEIGNIFKDKWIKETKLLMSVDFVKGKEYQITLSKKPYSMESVNLPFPIEIYWDNNFRVIKFGGRIITHNIEKGEYFDKSNYTEVDSNFKPLNKKKLFDGVQRYNKAALNKLMKGELSKDLLIKMNSREVFFKISIIDPQDKRKSGGTSFGYSVAEKENSIIIKKESQDEIDRDLSYVRSNYINQDIIEYFNITTEILPLKKRRK